MVKEKTPITPQLTVAALLKDYPKLEDVLIGLAPPFAKLRNPLLRRSVAKVATLRQAAAAAGLELAPMVNTLRQAAGQDPWTNDETAEEQDYWAEQPPWFAEDRVVASFDDRHPGDPNVMSLVPVSKAAKRLHDGEILRLVTSHLPAPGIDQMTAKGYAFWCHRKADDLVHTFFTPDPTQSG
ncbi:MAG: DUF1858 domain-containing protein [bacterium]|nr:DUF1858 domain-containing protein [bacterium]